MVQATKNRGPDLLIFIYSAGPKFSTFGGHWSLSLNPGGFGCDECKHCADSANSVYALYNAASAQPLQVDRYWSGYIQRSATPDQTTVIPGELISFYDLVSFLWYKGWVYCSSGVDRIFLSNIFFQPYHHLPDNNPDSHYWFLILTPQNIRTNPKASKECISLQREIKSI